jgi:hypothetical protein
MSGRLIAPLGLAKCTRRSRQDCIIPRSRVSSRPGLPETRDARIAIRRSQGTISAAKIDNTREKLFFVAVDSRYFFNEGLPAYATATRQGHCLGRVLQRRRLNSWSRLTWSERGGSKKSRAFINETTRKDFWKGGFPFQLFEPLLFSILARTTELIIKKRPRSHTEPPSRRSCNVSPNCSR